MGSCGSKGDKEAIKKPEEPSPAPEPVSQAQKAPAAEVGRTPGNEQEPVVAEAAATQEDQPVVTEQSTEELQKPADITAAMRQEPSIHSKLCCCIQFFHFFLCVCIMPISHSLLSNFKYVIVGGGTAAGYAAKEFADRGVAKVSRQLCATRCTR